MSWSNLELVMTIWHPLIPFNHFMPHEIIRAVANKGPADNVSTAGCKVVVIDH